MVLHSAASSSNASAAIADELVFVERIMFVALFQSVDLCVIQVFLEDLFVKGLLSLNNVCCKKYMALFRRASSAFAFLGSSKSNNLPQTGLILPQA